MWEIKRGIYSVMVGRSKKRRPLGGPRHRWEDLQEVDGEAWTGLLWVRKGAGGWLL
jgi:hypothetical protein